MYVYCEKNEADKNCLQTAMTLLVNDVTEI